MESFDKIWWSFLTHFNFKEYRFKKKKKKSKNSDKLVYKLELQKILIDFWKNITVMQINEVEELNSKHIVGVNHSNSIICVCNITFNRTILVTNVNLYFLTYPNQWGNALCFLLMTKHSHNNILIFMVIWFYFFLAVLTW